MGKALVIKGLEISSPLATVTFSDQDTFLSAYLAANTSISDTEKTALKTFFEGLFDNKLLSKMRYFYPMLGNNVPDMILEAISPSTEDIFSNLASLSSLSVTDRVLHSSIENNTEIINASSLSRFTLSDWRNMGVITATYHNTLSESCALNLGGQNGNNRIRTFELSSAFTERPPRVLAGYSGSALSFVPSSASADERTYLDRIIFIQWQGNTASVYKEQNLYASGASYADNITGLANLQICTAVNTSYKFLAFMDNLTTSEWGVFHGLLLTFLRAVGKHS